MSNPLDTLSPKSSFIVGLVTGILALCTIGFVVLLVITLRGGNLLATLQPGSKTPLAVGSPSPSPTPPSAPAGGGSSDNVPPVSAEDHIRGDAQAPVKLVEYSDLECPFCKSFHPTMQQVMDQYKGKVAWVYRHFPLSFHQNAQKEAEATECANELGGNTAFWNYLDKIFERTTSNGTGFALNQLGPLAKEIGLDQVKFQSCLDSGKYAQHVADDMAGGAAAGVSGTPGTIAIASNGKTYPIEGAQPLAAVKAVIDIALQQK